MKTQRQPTPAVGRYSIEFDIIGIKNYSLHISYRVDRPYYTLNTKIYYEPARVEFTTSLTTIFDSGFSVYTVYSK